MALDYKDLEDYGIIGNLETCALIGRDGSIDWLCFPYIESPSLFAAILDTKRGGHFRITPITKYESIQSYINNTNILQTTFSTPLGVAIITDFMDVKGREKNKNVRMVFRKIECVKGDVTLEISFKPRFEYAKLLPDFENLENGLIALGNDQRLFLQSLFPFEINDKEARGVVSVAKGESFWLVLQYNLQEFLQSNDCEKYLNNVKKFWQDWAHKCVRSECVLEGPWHEPTIRSGLILKLLANPDSGAIAAAPTTSLPEVIGGVRNWDYRYAWIRDASFTIQALFHLGHVKEAQDFRKWINEIVETVKDPSKIQILYGIHGEVDLKERILEHISGYRSSSPVRVGNDAAKQRQLDIYGELVNAVYDISRYGEEVSDKTWQTVRRIVEYVCEIWNTKDSGIWEVRGEIRHYVYSKLMCWVAIDRGIKIAEQKGFKAPLEKWKTIRKEIRQIILEKGFSKKLNSFVQSFDLETVDATSLLIPLMHFLPAADPRVQGTINAVLARLSTNEGLVHRYKSEDGLPGNEGTFILCSFWLIKTLALSGRIEESEKLLQNILKYISPLGLFAEEVDIKTGKLLGNFPQAFSHIGLINSVLYLSIAKGRKHKGPKPMGIH
ncbi:MAG: glycoside hydrolase family 15 protein [Promethearchaeota archaeon]